MNARNLGAGIKFLARAVTSRNRPLLAHLVVTRKCNLACTYCNEFDKVSDPVPLDKMESRIEALAGLGTAAITLTGGEPFLHPDLETIVRRCRSNDILTTLITNGYLLTPERIEDLNQAGLNELQISIDNIEPDEVSFKSLKVLDGKLQMLRDFARFAVNINSVLGISDERTPDAVEVARRAMEYGFSRSVGIVHDAGGRLEPLSPRQLEAYHEIGKLSKSPVHALNYRLFQRNLIEGRTNDWKCRAGARYLYVCEDGLVHWCSQQRGYPGIPVEEYTREDIQREFRTTKDCAPYCTVNCVQQMSAFNRWGGEQTLPDPGATARP